MTTKNGNREEANPPKKPRRNQYFKYSSLGFQMLISIGGGVWLGIYLDEKYNAQGFPVYTIVGSLIGVFLALYIPLKELLKNNKNP